MQRVLAMVFVLTLTLAGQQLSFAQRSAPNDGLPKVDYHMGQIRAVGQGLAVHVTNRGFAMSPQTSISVSIYNAKTRQFITSKSLRLGAMHPNQTKRAIFVPPNPGQPIMVRAMVDPGNRVKESNERNNSIASRH